MGTYNFTKRNCSLAAILSVLLFSLIGSVTGNCQWLGYDLEEQSCPPGTEEVVMEIHRTARQYLKQCCAVPPERLRKLKVAFSGCQVTGCDGSPSTSNMCDSLNERYVDGKQIVYEEIMRDNCNVPGGTGKAAYCCPKNSLESQLAVSWGAEPNEFPHQVKLDIDGSQCGGTIYNKRFIVTAAHCIVGKKDFKVKDAKKMKVMAGTNISKMKGEEFIYQVKKATSHEKYSKLIGAPELDKPERERRTYHDVAVLELVRDIQFSDKVKALEIAPKGFDPFKNADRAVIVGWGTTLTGDVSGHLQKANFRLRSDHTCFEYSNDAAYAHWNEFEKSLLCVGGIRDGTWSPTAGGGDSGGPAICRGVDGKAVLCGITSFGGDDDKCTKFNNAEHCWPSVYAEVAYYHDWIKSKAGEQDPKTFYKPYLYGEPVPRGKAEHQVHITSKSGRSCGGTLVAPDVVVTAARCVMKTDGSGKTHSGLKVHYGLRDVTGGEGKTYNIKGAVGLPNFPKKAKTEADTKAQGNHIRIDDTYLKDDLAVIKLDTKTPINPSKVAALPTFNDKFYMGREFAFPRNTTLTGELRAREFKVLDVAQCQHRMDLMGEETKTKLDLNLDQNLICGVEKYSGGSLCERELGGGLICQRDDGKEVLCGVPVFRLCDYTLPSVFMNMALYGNWVEKAMKALA